MGALAGAEAPAGSSRRQHQIPGGEVHEPDVTVLGPAGRQACIHGSLRLDAGRQRGLGERGGEPRVAGGRPCDAMTDSPSTSRTALHVASSSAHTRDANAPEHAVRGALSQDDERGGVGLEPAVMASSGHGPHVLQRHAVDLGHLAEQQ